MEVEQDLRAASDTVMNTLERLHELESEKRGLAPGTPRFRKIAREVERLSASVFAYSHVQHNLAEEVTTLREEAGVVVPPIDEIEPVRDISVILSDWRDAERQMAEATPGSAERVSAEADARRLRAEYRKAYEALTNPRTRRRRGTSLVED